MPGKVKSKKPGKIKVFFKKLRSRWQNSKLRPKLLRLFFGSGRFFFGAGIIRAGVEAIILALILFMLSLDNVVGPDFRLLAITCLPAATAVLVWLAIRLRPLAPPGKPWRFLRLSLLTTAIGWCYGLVVVLAGVLAGLTTLTFEDLTGPVNADLARTATSNSKFLPELQRFSMEITLWTGNPGPGDSPVQTLAIRVLVYSLYLTVAFVILRMLVGLVAIPGKPIYALTRRRLLWRLTFSHFWVVAAALVTTAVGTVVLISIPVLNRSDSEYLTTRDYAAIEARNIALVLQGDWRSQGSIAPEVLSQFISSLNRHSEVAFSQNPPYPLPQPAAPELVSQLVDNLPDTRNGYRNAYLVIAAANGTIIASNDKRLRPDTPLVEERADLPEQTDLQKVWQKIQAGETHLKELSITRAAPDLFQGGAYPVKDSTGQTVLVVIISKPPESILMLSFNLLGMSLALGLVVVLAGIFIGFFALVVALVFGYILSRRIVRNLQELEAGADALAEGNLAMRVQTEAEDEIGRLSRRFNQMAESLQQSQENLEKEKRTVEKTLQTRRELIANVSHELRTPVTTIRAYVDWLLQEAESEQQAPAATGENSNGNSQEYLQYLEIIGREAERLGLLIEDLLDLSRLETTGQTLELRPVQVEEVANEVKQMLGPMAQRERKISLTLALEPDLPPVLADRARLLQVILNLTRNAINYTPEGGIISISAYRDDTREVTLVVADTGIGIPSEDLERIFDRFYRADSSRSRQTGGAGLGLAIVKTLVEAMGGSITAESTPGEGSIFTLKLPVCKDTGAIAKSG